MGVFACYNVVMNNPTNRPCAVDSCNEPGRTRGLCSKHHYAVKVAGNLALYPTQVKNPPECKIPECSLKPKALGLCNTHYTAHRRTRSNGTPCSTTDCQRPATVGGLCDTHYQTRRSRARGIKKRKEGQSCQLLGFKWHVNTQGYWARRERTPDGKKAHTLQHRAVMEDALHRPLQKHENVHHINGDRRDNRVGNLELWSHSQPRGQRIEDKTAWAIEWLSEYKPELLR